MYDVTKFLDDHPGGDEVLLAATGNILGPTFSYPKTTLRNFQVVIQVEHTIIYVSIVFEL